MARIPQSYIASLTMGNSPPASINARASMLNPNTRLRLTAPQLRARNIQPVQVTAPRYTAEQNRDFVGPALSEVGNKLGLAAVRVADKQATLESAEAVNKFNDTARALWLGAPDGKGGFNPGYAASSEKLAAQGFGGFQSALNQARHDLATGLGDSARSKFLASSNGTYTNYMNQAANHAQGGQIAWEKAELNRTWQNAYQSIDDHLTTGDVQGALDLMEDTVTQLSFSTHFNPNKVPEMQQQVYRQMADFMGSKDDASAKLGVLQTALGDQFDLQTATHYNNAITRAVKDENSRADARIAREERDLRRARDRNNLNLFDMVSGGKGGEIDWEQHRRLAAAGRLSTSVYIAQRDRYITKGYLGPIPPDEEIGLKREILEGATTLDQVLGLQYDDASVRRMGNFFVSAQDQKMRADLTYGFSRIESTFKTKLTGYSTQDLALATTQAQADFERLLQEKTPAEALQIVQQSYITNYVPTVSAMIVLPGGTVIDLNTESEQESYGQIRMMEEAGLLSEQRAEEMYKQVEDFILRRETNERP